MKIKNKFTSNEKGITLAALVITIIMILILSAVLILSFDDIDVINATRDNIKVYKTDKEKTSEEVDKMVLNLDAEGRIDVLRKTEISKITQKITNSQTTLQELTLGYIPAEATDSNGNALSVKVEGAYNGGVADQVFTQSTLGARGLNWYVLSADNNGLNLVSDVTKAPVQFKDSSGYDNCLYYLNELSTKLFTNIQDYGVTADRVHAFRLTDIKYAAEQANKGVKVTENGEERDWSWDLDFVKASNRYSYSSGILREDTFTSADKYYPGLYSANSSKEVITNNPMYDENLGNKITTDSGIKRTIDGEQNLASKLTVNHTQFSTSNTTTTLTRLKNYGKTSIAKELFNSDGKIYWLASRCIYYDSSVECAHFDIRRVYSGYIGSYNMCYSDGSMRDNSHGFRVVVSIPPSHFDIAEDGTVTLK